MKIGKRGDSDRPPSPLNLLDIEWLLKIIRTHLNLYGSDLEQSVDTITKLQEQQQKKKKGLDEIYRR